MDDKLIPHLWYDTQAREAAELYTSALPDSRIVNVVTIRDTPSGDCEVVTMKLGGRDFQAISAGPHFKFTPAISLLVHCATKEEVDRIWSRLSAGGQLFMPLQAYPFSEYYGWTSDRFGLSWQIMLVGDQPVTEKIVPKLMFVGDVAGRAEEAIEFYTSLFQNSSKGEAMRFGPGMGAEKEGELAHASFTLAGRALAAMDSRGPHEFGFNEALSLMLCCQDQAEIDFFWGKLSAVTEAEMCGWLKDKFGVSWQIVPASMDEMLSGDEGRKARVRQAFLKMKKFDVAQLEAAAR